MSASLVGSEMCIRDRPKEHAHRDPQEAARREQSGTRGDGGTVDAGAQGRPRASLGGVSLGLRRGSACA
eukprot:8869825-Alexandrium_andersonii.AAC.1